MTTRTEDGISRVTMDRAVFGLPHFGPSTLELCIVTLTIIAVTIGPASRNTLDITPKDLAIEVVMIVVMTVADVRHNCFMQRNQIPI